MGEDQHRADNEERFYWFSIDSLAGEIHCQEKWDPNRQGEKKTRDC